MENLISRTSIIAVANGKYTNSGLPNLRGPENDIEKIRNLFCENDNISIFSESQARFYENITSEDFRNIINKYLVSRSAEGDILVFYFSGHGVSIGRNDFGFCFSNTIIHEIENLPLPLSVVSFREILRTLYIRNVIPVVIIDACYSGLAAKHLEIPEIEAVSILHNNVHEFFPSEYALLCSCLGEEISFDTGEGGVFSHYLYELASVGNGENKKNNLYLSLQDLYPELFKKCFSYSHGDSRPRLFISSLLPNFPICINSQYNPNEYCLVGHLINVLYALWNDGEPRELLPQEILEITESTGSYANHKKLSLSGWDLVENVGNSKSRRLTKRGIQFFQGKLEVPKCLMINPSTGQYENHGSEMVSIHDFEEDL